MLVFLSSSGRKISVVSDSSQPEKRGACCTFVCAQSTWLSDLAAHICGSMSSLCSHKRSDLRVSPLYSHGQRNSHLRVSTDSPQGSWSPRQCSAVRARARTTRHLSPSTALRQGRTLVSGSSLQPHCDAQCDCNRIGPRSRGARVRPPTAAVTQRGLLSDSSVETLRFFSFKMDEITF